MKQFTLFMGAGASFEWDGDSEGWGSFFTPDPLYYYLKLPTGSEVVDYSEKAYRVTLTLPSKTITFFCPKKLVKESGGELYMHRDFLKSKIKD